MNALIPQLINLFASVILILAFAMLSQRRILSLIYLYTWQGLAVVGSTTVVAYVTSQHHLYYSAGLTLLLKVILIPFMLHRLIDRLNVRWDIETLVNIPTLMIVGSHDENLPNVRQAVDLIGGRKTWRSIAGTDEFFREPGALDAAATLAIEWFRVHLERKPAQQGAA